MPGFNGSGSFVRTHNWVQDLANLIPVTASRCDAEDDGFATGLSNTICRDGQSTTTARIPFASGLSAAAGTTASVAYAQTNDPNTGMYFPGSDQWGLVCGGTEVLTGTATKLTAQVAVDFDGVAAPTSNDGAALGSATQMWSDLFLASGAVINFNNGDVTVTHAANALNFAGGTVTFDTAPTPSSSDAAALGTASVMWADLFLASGAVINFNNGDVTVTHSANALAFAGASSGYSFDAAVTISSGGLTVSAGSVDFPAGSIAEADLASPGKMKLIHSQIASNSANIDFNASNSASAFDGTYDHLELRLSSVKPATDDVNLRIQVGTGATPTYQTSGYHYQGLQVGAGSVAAFGSTIATGVQLNLSGSGAGIGNATGENIRGSVEFDSPDATDFLNFSTKSTFVDAGGAAKPAFSGGHWNTAGAVTAIRLLMSSGNIASGTFSLYGIKNS